MLETLPDTTIVVCNEPKAESESTVDETADIDDEPTAQEDSSSDANNKETDSNEDKKSRKDDIFCRAREPRIDLC